MSYRADYSGKLTDPCTTRGDIIVRGASATTRLALGAAKYGLSSDGTDVLWTPKARTTVGDIGKTLSQNGTGLATALNGGSVSNGFPLGYAAGDVVEVVAGGFLQNTVNASTYRWQLLGWGSALIDFTTSSFTASANPFRWVLRATIMYQTIGASATVSVVGTINITKATANAFDTNVSANFPIEGATTVAALATNADAVFDLQMAHSDNAATTQIVSQMVHAFYQPKL